MGSVSLTGKKISGTSLDHFHKADVFYPHHGTMSSEAAGVLIQIHCPGI